MRLANIWNIIAQNKVFETKQECIPVGCVLSVAVAAGGVYPSIHYAWGGVLPGGCLPQCMLGYTPPDRILDTNL